MNCLVLFIHIFHFSFFRKYFTKALQWHEEVKQTLILLLYSWPFFLLIGIWKHITVIVDFNITWGFWFYTSSFIPIDGISVNVGKLLNNLRSGNPVYLCGKSNDLVSVVQNENKASIFIKYNLPNDGKQVNILCTFLPGEKNVMGGGDLLSF